MIGPDLPGPGRRREESFTPEGARATIGALDLLADVAAIGVPLTVVGGEHDPFRRHEAMFMEAARDADLVILGDFGHFANLSRPERFAKVLRRCAGRTVAR